MSWCCEYLKDRKNESHSQRSYNDAQILIWCCEYLKDRKNESHSQPAGARGRALLGCCEYLKDRKNESHSQLMISVYFKESGVVSISKIGKMKAIHNQAYFFS